MKIPKLSRSEKRALITLMLATERKPAQTSKFKREVWHALGRFGYVVGADGHYTLTEEGRMIVSAVGLTVPQRQELQRLGVRTRNHIGYATVRVQKTLIRRGLARVARHAPNPGAPFGAANCAEVEITDDGRIILRGLAS